MPINFPATTCRRPFLIRRASWRSRNTPFDRLPFYAGFELIQFAPSDPQTSFRDEGFLFVQAAAGGTGNSGNGTGINNVAFSVACGTGLQ
jgi:hypothetical protein